MRRAFVLVTVLGILGAVAAPSAKEVYNEYWLIHRGGQAVTRLLSPEGQAHGGTGFQIAYRNQQYTMTNDHVCAMGNKKGYLLAVPTFGYVREIKILARSEDTDLCLLEAMPDRPAFRLSDTNLKRGDKITVLGHPLLHTLKASHGKVRKYETINVLERIIQTEEDKAACTGKKRSIVPVFFGLMEACIITVPSINTSVKVKPGNSGSPVIKDRQVVGVLFAGAPNGDGSIIPLNDIKKFLKAYHETREQR